MLQELHHRYQARDPQDCFLGHTAEIFTPVSIRDCIKAMVAWAASSFSDVLLVASMLREMCCAEREHVLNTISSSSPIALYSWSLWSAESTFESS